jgi:DNA adenine methylase
MQIPRRAQITARRTVAAKRIKRAAPKQAPSPVLKWVGGKTRLLSKLQERMPSSFGKYFEPFMGGGALFFRTAPTQAVLGDYNADLINVYKCVAWDVDKVARKLAAHKRNHSEEYYYQVRTKWNERNPRQTDIDRASQFLYMNKTCFNGLYRVNSKGEFNVPVGRYVNPSIYDLSSLRAASAALQNAEILHGHYSEVVSSASAGDFVYFDPPYHPLTATANFTSYTSNAFTPNDQRELRDLANDLAGRGCAVLLSNSDTPFIRELFAGWNIDQVMCGRSINSKASARGAVAEVMIYNDF